MTTRVGIPRRVSLVDVLPDVESDGDLLLAVASDGVVNTSGHLQQFPITRGGFYKVGLNH